MLNFRDRLARQLAIRRAVGQCHIRTGGTGIRVNVTKTLDDLQKSGVPLVPDRIDDAEVAEYARRAEYEFYYPDYYRGRDLVLLKKIREHFMAARLLELGPEDTYLDIASQSSPAPSVYERLFKCRVLRQDLEYPPGLGGRVIGGSAGCLPLDAGSITKMALHCSLEHFEGDEDIALILEARRVLAKGGRLVIVPLYLSDHYFVVTQPNLWAMLPREQWPVFPVGASRYAPESARNRHERYYDFEQFFFRLVDKTDMQVRIHNFGDSDSYPTGAMRFAAVFEKNEDRVEGTQSPHISLHE